jgi:hypothetical protein
MEVDDGFPFELDPFASLISPGLVVEKKEVEDHVSVDFTKEKLAKEKRLLEINFLALQEQLNNLKIEAARDLEACKQVAKEKRLHENMAVQAQDELAVAHQ